MSRAAHLLGGRASPEKRRIRNDRWLRGDVRSCFASKKAFLLKSMARSKGQGATPQKGIPSVTPEVGFRLLSQQILKGQQLSDSATRDDGLESLSERIVKGEEIQLLSADDFHAWNNTTRNYIDQAFGENHRNLENFDLLEGFTDNMWPRYRWSIHYAETLQHKIAAINGYLEELKTEILIRQCGSSAGANIEHEPSRKVFIVHGHDSELKHATARLVTNLGLEPVILHEQANKGRTIIEKFTEYAQVGFAIVLLSADDEGRSRDPSSAHSQLRARQNVIFEMGFFFSRLGRERVCVVYESGVELPSDLSGILYVQYDSGKGWMYAVAEEMKATGYEVDLNAV
jgi:predicted nucleotide-binding protein